MSPDLKEYNRINSTISKDVWCFIQKKTWNYLIIMLGGVQKKKIDY